VLFRSPVAILLPKGDAPHFPLCYEALNDNGAFAGIVKDAGDDPDVTHGATIISHVIPLPPGSGIIFCAGEGVGTVTKPGLPINVGEAAINPMPRKMMTEIIEEICTKHGLPADLQVTISIPGGEEIAKQTWNPRLGIIGGLSILGTTGVVHPFSCSAWIHSIHSGIDVARAQNTQHVIAATGSTSETAAQKIYNLPETDLLDMGDFAGGVLKYLRKHPLPKITIAGGFAKLTKLAQGALDLHSARSQVDFDWLLEQIESTLEVPLKKDIKNQIQNANTAMEVLEITKKLPIDLPMVVAIKAKETALTTLKNAPVEVEIFVISRDGKLLARTQ